MLYLVIEHFRGGDPRPVYARFAERGRLAPEGLRPTLSHADEVVRPVQGSARGAGHAHPRDVQAIPKSRDFH